jgi:hypothetical protein
MQKSNQIEQTKTKQIEHRGQADIVHVAPLRQIIIIPSLLVFVNFSICEVWYVIVLHF